MSLSGLTFSSISKSLERVRSGQAFIHKPKELQAGSAWGNETTRSNPVSGPGHDLRGSPHQRAHDTRKRSPAGRPCRIRMLDLIKAHGVHDRATFVIRAGQTLQVLIQMPFALPLRLGDKSQTGAIPEGRRRDADGEGAGIPQGIEQARRRPEFA